MKLVIDGIIENLQVTGGCSIYFQELLKRYLRDGYDLEFLRTLGNIGEVVIKDGSFVLNEGDKRLLERWRDVEYTDSTSGTVFHSTHYRIPNKRMPTVTTVHDFTYERFNSGARRFMHSWQKKRAIYNSDIIICVSNNTADDLQKYCRVDDSKIRVIHNGVSNLYSRLSSVQMTDEVVFIGVRGGYKNFDVAVKSVAKSNLSLSIVGGGELLPAELKLLEFYLPGRYKFLGRLSNSELNFVYNRAFCLLYPSSYEGFGIPIVEAMRSGCPVIAVNCSSIPEVAGCGALLVENANIEVISDALTKLLFNDYREALITKGLKQSTKFSWEKCYQETLAVYKELA